MQGSSIRPGRGMIGIVDLSRVGGGEVFRPFNLNGTRVPAGTQLTREQLLSMKTANLRGLVDNRYLTVWPESASDSPHAGKPTKRFIITLGGGKFGVVEGWRLNQEMLTREEAETLRDAA